MLRTLLFAALAAAAPAALASCQEAPDSGNAAPLVEREATPAAPAAAPETRARSQVGSRAENAAPQSCDMRMSKRSASVARYVRAAKRCLQTPPAGLRFDEAAERESLRLVNEERRERGLRPVELRPSLRAAARFHSLDLGTNDFFDHTSLKGRSPGQRVAAFDRSLILRSSRENIAMLGGQFKQDKAVEIMHANLMASPGHRKAILAPGITHAAMGVARRADGIWLTQVFVGKEGELERSVPLELPTGTRPPGQPELESWDFWRYEYASEAGRGMPVPDEALGTSFVSPGAAGQTVRIFAAGRRAGDAPGVTEIIHLSGPSATIVPTVPGAPAADGAGDAGNGGAPG